MKEIIIKKVKLITDGGVDLSYVSTLKEDERSFNDKVEVESDKHPHHDLVDAIKALKSYVMLIVGLNIAEIFEGANLTKPEKVSFKGLGKAMQRIKSKGEENVKVTGIALSGDSENLNVIITSVLTTPKGFKIAINTPKCNLSADVYGFEPAFRDDVDLVIEEARLFLLEDKKAQLSLDFKSNGEEAEVDKKVKELVKA